MICLRESSVKNTMGTRISISVTSTFPGLLNLILKFLMKSHEIIRISSFFLLDFGVFFTALGSLGGDLSFGRMDFLPCVWFWMGSTFVGVFGIPLPLRAFFWLVVHAKLVG